MIKFDKSKQHYVVEKHTKYAYSLDVSGKRFTFKMIHLKI